MDLYLIRHCECTSNAMKILAGNSEYPPTERGLLQLEALKERFREIRLDKVYSSPLSRAYKTGEAVALYSGVPVIRVTDLHEWSQGTYEGNPAGNYTPEEKEFLLAHPMDFRRNGGPEAESARDVQNRILPVFRQIVSENPGKTVAVTTHGGVIKILLRVLKNVPEAEFRTLKVPDNTGVALLRFSDFDHCEIVYENDTSHLSSEISTHWL